MIAERPIQSHGHKSLLHSLEMTNATSFEKLSALRDLATPIYAFINS